jgi:hypothetical protein
MSAHRKATSPEELAQVVRVHGLLSGIDVVRRRQLAVTTANFETRTGRPVRLQVRNTRDKAGHWSSRGVLTLATEDGELEINFLDIVSVDAPARAAPEHGKSRR